MAEAKEGSEHPGLSTGPVLGAKAILGLQRRAGNAAVLTLLRVQRSPLSGSVQQLWTTTGNKGRVFTYLRSAPRTAATDADLSAVLAQIFGGQPDDLWLAQALQQYGAEPLWPTSAISERIRRANDPAHPWAREPGNIEASLGTTAGLAAGPKRSAIPPSQVTAYFFPGRTDARALIIGGVHGGEQSGIEVVEALRASLAAAPRPPRFTTILVPVLFPDNRAYEQQRRAADPAGTRGKDLFNESGGRYTRLPTPKGEIVVEPNRNYPRPGESLQTAEQHGLRFRSTGDPLKGYLLSATLLPETRMLLTLIERFRPERIASVHGHKPSSEPGDAPGIFVDPRGGFKQFTDPATTNEGKDDDALATAMVSHARGLRSAGHIADHDNPGGIIHYKPEAAGKRRIHATSLGGWAPVPVKEGGTGDRPAMTIVTVEVENDFPSADDPEMAKRVEVHRDTLQSVFLERP